jgi:hypothetical protein
VENDKNPVEQALDLFVYAPLGFALDARELMPKLVERGRNQVTMARMIGQFAVNQGQVVAGKQLGKVEQQLQAALENFGLVPPSHNGSAPPTVRTSPNLVAVPDVVDPTDDVALVAEPPTVEPVGRDRLVPEAASLAIPDYDSLAASQVIPRLAGLSPAELDVVRLYEAGKRGRKTILSRITQLQSA